jgi:hypothetical protein
MPYLVLCCARQARLWLRLSLCFTVSVVLFVGALLVLCYAFGTGLVALRVLLCFVEALLCFVVFLCYALSSLQFVVSLFVFCYAPQFRQLVRLVALRY